MRIDLNDMRLKALPEGFRMLPGMSVTAEVKVGLRSVLSYFLYPLMRGLDREHQGAVMERHFSKTTKKLELNS